jgi:hypothetical protein
MTNHELKTWPEYFEATLNGRKRFELRKNDRNFEAGDCITLMEYDPDKSEYSGREVYCGINYILHGGQFGLAIGYCIMSIIIKGQRGI